jgi:hypothetical protein
MEPVNRRSFLVRASVGVAGAGVAASTAGFGYALTDQSDVELEPEEVAAAVDLPVMLHVRDVSAGEVEILLADQSIVFTDRALVAKLLRAAR